MRERGRGRREEGREPLVSFTSDYGDKNGAAQVVVAKRALRLFILAQNNL